MKILTTIANQLQDLKGQLDPEDKRTAARKLNVHTETVNRYLNGGVKKPAFGAKLLTTFKTIISEREKSVA